MNALKTKIIVISGRAQSGKDTFCDFSMKKLHVKYSSRKYAFADFLKNIGEIMFDIPQVDSYGTNEDKNKLTNIKVSDLPFSSWLSVSQREYLTIREFLQFFGSDICRKIYPNCWVNACLHQINSENYDYAFICDARFPNEIESFLNPDILNKYQNIDPNPIIIRFERNILKGNHISETALDSFNWQKAIIIHNENMTVDEKNTAAFDLLWKKICNS